MQFGYFKTYKTIKLRDEGWGEGWGVECGVWNVECGVWNVECVLRNVECGLRVT